MSFVNLILGLRVPRLAGVALCLPAEDRSVLVVQNVTGLAFKDSADRIQGGEPHRFGPSVLKYCHVCRGDADCLREVADGHSALGQ